MNRSALCGEKNFLDSHQQRADPGDLAAGGGSNLGLTKGANGA